MCRISATDPNAVTSATKQILDAVEIKFGMVPMMVRTMAQSGAVVTGWAALGAALAQGELSERTAELIALSLAQANSCNYCLALHTASSGVVGLTSQDVLEARRGRAADGKEAAAVALALAILDTRGGVSDDALAVALAAGLSDADICEVSAHVALNVFSNYFNRLADTEIDFPKVDARLPGPRV